MSGRFVCKLRRVDQHKLTTTDRPNNPALFQENQKSLSDLIKMREEQDKGAWPTVPLTHDVAPTPPPHANTLVDTSVTYTPWKTPSTQ